MHVWAPEERSGYYLIMGERAQQSVMFRCKKYNAISTSRDNYESTRLGGVAVVVPCVCLSPFGFVHFKALPRYTIYPPELYRSEGCIDTRPLGRLHVEYFANFTVARESTRLEERTTPKSGRLHSFHYQTLEKL